MASTEDRPIIVSGGDQMVTVTLPSSSTPHGGDHIVNALSTVGPFTTIEFTTGTTNTVEFRRPATGTWKITIR